MNRKMSILVTTLAALAAFGVLLFGAVWPYASERISQELAKKWPFLDTSQATLQLSFGNLSIRKVHIHTDQLDIFVDDFGLEFDLFKWEVSPRKLSGVSVKTSLGHSASTNKNQLAADFSKPPIEIAHRAMQRLQELNQDRIIEGLSFVAKYLEKYHSYFNSAIEVIDFTIQGPGGSMISCQKAIINISADHTIQSVCVRNNTHSKIRLLLKKKSSNGPYLFSLTLLDSTADREFREKLVKGKFGAYSTFQLFFDLALVPEIFDIERKVLKGQWQGWVQWKGAQDTADIALQLENVSLKLEALGKRNVELPKVQIESNIDFKSQKINANIYPSVTKGLSSRDPKNSLHLSMDLSEDSKRNLLTMEGQRVTCSDLLAMMPGNVRDQLQPIKASGIIGLSLRLDLAASWDFAHLYSKFKNKCEFEDLPNYFELNKFDLWQSSGLAQIMMDREIFEATPLDDFPDQLIDVVTGFEDAFFFAHEGIWPASLFEALRRNLTLGRVKMGASTLSMQVVKNAFLSPLKSFERKQVEFFLTLYLEATLSKRQIIEIYFNLVEMGPEVYGFANAAEKYFGKAPSELVLYEMAFLASLLPNPQKRSRYYCIGRISKTMKRYIDRKLYNLVTLGKLSHSEYFVAINTTLHFKQSESDSFCE